LFLRSTKPSRYLLIRPSDPDNAEAIRILEEAGVSFELHEIAGLEPYLEPYLGTYTFPCVVDSSGSYPGLRAIKFYAHQKALEKRRKRGNVSSDVILLATYVLQREAGKLPPKGAVIKAIADSSLNFQIPIIPVINAHGLYPELTEQLKELESRGLLEIKPRIRRRWFGWLKEWKEERIEAKIDTLELVKLTERLKQAGINVYELERWFVSWAKGGIGIEKGRKGRAKKGMALLMSKIEKGVRAFVCEELLEKVENSQSFEYSVGDKYGKAKSSEETKQSYIKDRVMKEVTVMMNKHPKENETWRYNLSRLSREIEKGLDLTGEDVFFIGVIIVEPYKIEGKDNFVMKMTDSIEGKPLLCVYVEKMPKRCLKGHIVAILGKVNGEGVQARAVIKLGDRHQWYP